MPYAWMQLQGTAWTPQRSENDDIPSAQAPGDSGTSGMHLGTWGCPLLVTSELGHSRGFVVQVSPGVRRFHGSLQLV